MRKHLPLAVACLLALQSYSQRVVIPNIKSGPGYTMPSNMYAPNNVGNNYPDADMQAQYERGAWTRGRVKFKDGREGRDVLLLFDVFQNKLYFKSGRDAMEFLNPVYEFEMGLLVGPDTTGVLYRCFYPAVNTNTAETFYEVIVDASIQLLKCRAKNVNLYKDGGEVEQKRNTEKTQWYIYLPEGKMVKVKPDKNQVLAAMPDRADQINKLIREKGFRLKQEDDLIALVVAMNAME